MANFLSTPEAANYLGLSRRTLEAWRVRGFGPVFTKFGSRAMYARDDLQRWAAEQKRQSTSESAAA